MAEISIIVPVYNVEKYIGQCLESLVNQTFRDIEIIVVDDGSPDKSHEIYEAYARRDERVKIIRKENAGVSEARNTGLESATGRFVMFIDSDDWMETDGCENLYRAQAESGAELVVADVWTVTDGDKKRKRIFKAPVDTRDRDFIRAYQAACIGYGYNPSPYERGNITGLGGPWNKLFVRDIIVQNQLRYDPYVKGIYDDSLFTIHYLNHVNRLCYIDTPVYNYRVVSTSLTNAYRPNTLDISQRIFERIRDFTRAQQDPGYFQKPYYMYVFRRLSKELTIYYFAPDSPKSLRDSKAELKRMLDTEPYKSAIRQVEYNRLASGHKLMYLCAKLHSPTLLYWQMKLRNT